MPSHTAAPGSAPAHAVIIRLLHLATILSLAAATSIRPNAFTVPMNKADCEVLLAFGRLTSFEYLVPSCDPPPQGCRIQTSRYSPIACTPEGRIRSINSGAAGADLMGGLPAALGTLTELQQLLIRGKTLALRGTLPDSLGNLKKLETLKLYEHWLSGTLPTSWGNMSKLRTLDVHNNRLSGPIPRSWSQLPNLKILNLSNNALTGPLPTSFSPSVVELYLTGNLFNGTLSAFWSNLKAIRGISIAGAHVRGTLPPSWGALSKLIRLDLSENRLTGPLPSAWSKLTSLQELNLDGNGITGTIPVEWEELPPDLSRSITLRLERTGIHGPLLQWQAQVNLHLSLDNQLCGAVPLTVNMQPSFKFNGRLPRCPSQPGQKLVATDKRCGQGPEKKCPPGQGCSLSGWCGNASIHTDPNKGCQPLYGSCQGSRYPVSLNGTCGPVGKGWSCPVGLCCGRNNTCGSDPLLCASKNGCQRRYGMCDVDGGLIVGSTSTGPTNMPKIPLWRLNDSVTSTCKDYRRITSQWWYVCEDYTVPYNGMTMDIVAAKFGTVPRQIIDDNVMYSAALFAFQAGDNVRVRPTSTLSPRWAPEMTPHEGPLDDSYPHPCSVYWRDRDIDKCICSYHPEGVYVWPNGKCDQLITCSGGAFLQRTTCPAGQVAYEGDDFNGQSTCIERPINFVCGDGCSSMFCFCHEYLLNNGTYLNPFDSTRTTGIICDSTQKGWFGGMLFCEGAYFDPWTKKCNASLDWKKIPYRKGFTDCDGSPFPPPAEGNTVAAVAQPQSTPAPKRKMHAAAQGGLFNPIRQKLCGARKCCARYSQAQRVGCVPCKAPSRCKADSKLLQHVRALNAKYAKCYCQLWGECPVWFNNHCSYTAPAKKK